jgi:hypothetical protein
MTREPFLCGYVISIYKWRNIQFPSRCLPHVHFSRLCVFSLEFSTELFRCLILSELFTGTYLVCCASAVSYLLCTKSFVLHFTHWQKERKKRMISYRKVPRIPHQRRCDPLKYLPRLGAFAKLRKVSISFVMFVRLSVCPSVRVKKTRHPLDRI